MLAIARSNPDPAGLRLRLRELQALVEGLEVALDDVAVVVAPPKEWDGIREALVEAGISEAGVKSLDFYPLERPRKPLAAALTASGPAS